MAASSTLRTDSANSNHTSRNNSSIATKGVSGAPHPPSAAAGGAGGTTVVAAREGPSVAGRMGFIDGQAVLAPEGVVKDLRRRGLRPEEFR